MLVDSHQNQNQTNEEDLWDWSTITHLRESDVVMKAKLRAAAGFTGRRDASGMNLTAYVVASEGQSGTTMLASMLDRRDIVSNFGALNKTLEKVEAGSYLAGPMLAGVPPDEKEIQVYGL
tara:strand:+ start:307 stop:666 length:360 start_codon:yes stop_codon:yes gene_type:complete